MARTNQNMIANSQHKTRVTLIKDINDSLSKIFSNEYHEFLSQKRKKRSRWKLKKSSRRKAPWI